MSEISASPFGKTKRRKWSKEEKRVILTHFGNLENLSRLPSLAQCTQLRETYPILKMRSPQMIKTWIDNQRRAKTRQLDYAHSVSK